MEQCSPDHPKVLFLLALEGEPTPQQVEVVRAWAARLMTSRTWTVPAPQLVDETDDENICTLGVFTHLYSSFPPWGESIPLSVDASQLEDVRDLITAGSELSRSVGEDIVVEYNGEAIGWIERGRPDDNITVGLLEEWRRGLDSEAQRRAKPRDPSDPAT